MIEAKRTAPDFSLQDAEGKQVGLSDFRGRKVVLYFYPKDDTPGCTKEACGFRDVYREIEAKGAVVIGISPDTVESHRKFRDKFGLPFLLLADPERKTIGAYGAWGKKMRFGKEVEGVLRSTFIIDEQGTVAKVYPNVSPEEHAGEVLAALSA